MATVNYSRFTGPPDSLGISQDPPPNPYPDGHSKASQLKSVERSFQMMLAHPRDEIAHPVRKNIEYAVYRREFGPEEHLELPDTVAAVPHYTGHVDSYGIFPYKNSTAPHSLGQPLPHSLSHHIQNTPSLPGSLEDVTRSPIDDNASPPALTPDLAGGSPSLHPERDPVLKDTQFLSAFQDSSSLDGSSEGSLSSFEDYSNVLQQIRSRDTPRRGDTSELPSPHASGTKNVPTYESTFYDDDNNENRVSQLRWTPDVRESVLIPGKQTVGGLDLYPRWDQLKPRRAAIAPQYAADDSYNTSQDVEPLVPQYEIARGQHVANSRLRVPQLVQSQSQHGSREGIFPAQVTKEGQPQLPLSTLWKRSDGIDKGGPLLAGMPSLPSFPRSDSQVIVDAQACDRWGRPECSPKMFISVFIGFVFFPPCWLLLGSGYLDSVVGVVPRRAKQLSLIAGGLSFIAAVAIALALALA